MGRIPKLRSVLLTTLVLAAVALSADAAQTVHGFTIIASHRHRPIVIHHVRDTTVGSYNWSGYAVTAVPGAVTAVKGSWVVPAVQPGSCTSGTTNEYASFWVGIDGFTSNTVEQTGTDSDCQNGVPTYYAWFEFYPHPAFMINSLSIQPGDVMEAEVRYNPATRRFTVAINNQTTGQSFSTSTKVNNAQRSSAEWIAEAPSGSGGVLPLANFGTAVYGMDSTGVIGTSDATVSGTTAPIGSFGSNVYQINMVSVSDPSVLKALPSSLSSDGTSFSDGWVRSGP
jgi:Peptidase A4 family